MFHSLLNLIPLIPRFSFYFTSNKLIGPECYVISAWFAPTLPRILFYFFSSYTLSLPSIHKPTDGKWCYNELSHHPPRHPHFTARTRSRAPSPLTEPLGYITCGETIAHPCHPGRQTLIEYSAVFETEKFRVSHERLI